MKMKTCPTCGRTFEARTDQIYCSRNCFDESRRMETKRDCPICGKSFRAKMKNQIYCGKSCAAYGRARERQANPGAKKEPEIRKCAYCGAEYQARNRNQRFCCTRCASKAYAAKEREKLPKREAPLCPICGKAVPARGNQKFCSRACANAAARMEKHDLTPMGQRGKDLVRIRITRQIPVLPELRPPVGSVYEAERAVIKRGSGGLFYVIREIGRLGLVVREHECVEV